MTCRIGSRRHARTASGSEPRSRRVRMASPLGRHAENFRQSTAVSVTGKPFPFPSASSSRFVRPSTDAPSTSRIERFYSRDFPRRSGPICSPSIVFARSPANVHQRVAPALSRTTAVLVASTQLKSSQTSLSLTPARLVSSTSSVPSRRTRRIARHSSNRRGAPDPIQREPVPVRYRFICSTLRNGRHQPSSTEGADRYRSDQSQILSGALATTGTSTSAGRSTSSSTRTFFRTGSHGRFSPAQRLEVDLGAARRSRNERERRSPGRWRVRPISVSSDSNVEAAVAVAVAVARAASTFVTRTDSGRGDCSARRAAALRIRCGSDQVALE